ncbi:unnamed protein product [Spirodela intermedia]|uniref:Nucleoplasmin-like domain-containing protein n=1 Tax=Spirodela intermedia TaxID=51605 RepID=A0A7I8L5U8_SPIIN|nr:unnamed protein product [Spirodela intermedia]
MEFWGIEVKSGETVKCEPGDDKFLHLSQASLGETKKDKGNESITVYVKFNDQKLVIGSLSAEKCPQIQYDLVFEKEFELSHNWKKGSVFFVGYKTVLDEGYPFYDPAFFHFFFLGKSFGVNLLMCSSHTDDSESESEEEIAVKNEANGKPESSNLSAKPKVNAPKTGVAKPSIKAEEEKKVKKDDADKDSGSDDDEDESDEDDSDDADMLDGEGDSSDDENDEDDSSDEELDATPKAEVGKKRPVESASKNTPAAEKKTKLMTPVGSQKTGGGDTKKGGGHTATPHPAKQGGRTPPTNDRAKQPQTPKSGGGSARFNNNKSGGK